jgi:hypothetical protein
MPGSAPLTPAVQVPFVVATLPFSYSLVSSPKYQTVPSRCWAYQSKVSSLSWPSSLTVSRTSTQVTPMIVLVLSVTVTTVVSTPSPVCARILPSHPGRSGKNGLSMVAVKAAGSMRGAYTPVTGAADPAGTGTGAVGGLAAAVAAPGETVADAVADDVGREAAGVPPLPPLPPLSPLPPLHAAAVATVIAMTPATASTRRLSVLRAVIGRAVATTTPAAVSMRRTSALRTVIAGG